MKILFDYQGFDMQTHGGISRSFVEIYRHLLTHHNPIIGVRETDNLYLKELGFKPTGYRMGNFITQANFPGKSFLFRAYNKIFNLGYGMDYNQRYSIKLLEKGDYDVFHPTFFKPYFLEHLHGKPFVLTVHDMTPELNPEYYPADYHEIVNKRLLIPSAAAIVAVSENTKHELLRFFPDVKPDKVHVVYHGPSFAPSLTPTSAKSEKKYILYVGHRWKYKNFAPFVKHIAPFLKAHPEVNVVCTGEQFYSFEYELFDKYGIIGRFTSTFVRDDQGFIDLYHNALAFVYPSWSEGFGMPILEAFQAQTPCVLNHASCFPEIGGDAALYFDINEVDSDLSDVVEKVYRFSDTERQTMIDRQLKRLADFSWQKSARQLISIYDSISNTTHTRGKT